MDRSQPVWAMTKYLDTTTHNNKPLFIFCNGSYLTRSSLTSILKALLGRSGIDISRYSSHSFRIGAATTAAAANVPDWLLKVMGRWASSHTRSIKTGSESLRVVTLKMATTSIPLNTQPWAVEWSNKAIQLLTHFEVNSVWPYWGLILAVILEVGRVITQQVLCICLYVDILVIDLENILTKQ